MTNTPPPKPAADELRQKCADIQLNIGIDDIEWQKRFDNTNGLFGLIQQEKLALLAALREDGWLRHENLPTIVGVETRRELRMQNRAKSYVKQVIDTYTQAVKEGKR